MPHKIHINAQKCTFWVLTNLRDWWIVCLGCLRKLSVKILNWKKVYLSKSESLATEKAREAACDRWCFHCSAGSVLDMNDCIWLDSLSGAGSWAGETSSFSLTVVRPSLVVTRVGRRAAVWWWGMETLPLSGLRDALLCWCFDRNRLLN